MSDLADVVRVQAAWDSNPLSTSPAWHPINRVQQGSVRRGRSNGTWMPGTAQVTVLDPDGVYDGAKMNKHLYLRGTSGQYIYTPHATALSFGTTGYMRWRFELLDWFPEQPYDWARLVDKGWSVPNLTYFIGVRNGSVGGTSAGDIDLGISPDGTSPVTVSRWDGASQVLGPGVWLEVESYISGGSRVTIWRASTDGGATFTEHHRDTYGSTALPYANTENLAIGATNTGGSPYKGRLGRVQAWWGTTPAVDLDANDHVAGASWSGPLQTWTDTGLGSNISFWQPSRQRRLRIAASEDGFSTSTFLFDGYVQTVTAARTSRRNLVTITATDLVGWLASFRLTASEAPRERTGERINRILGAVGIPASFIGFIDSGQVEMPPATIEGNALQLCQEAVRAEDGHLFVKPTDGKLYYRQRWRQVYGAESDWHTTALTLGRSGVAVLDSWGGELSGSTTRTVGNRNGGEPIESDLTPGEWFAETNQLPGIEAAWDSDVHAAVSAASFMDYPYFEATRGFTVLAYPGHAAGLGAAVDELAPVNRVALVHRPKGSAADRTDDLVIEQVTHSIDGRRDRWTVTCETSPYDRFDQLVPSEWFQLGVSTLNGTKRLAY